MDGTSVLNTFLVSLPGILTALAVVLPLVRKVDRIEKHTNSMHDKIVTSEKQESRAVGHSEGLAEGRAEDRPGPTL